MAALSPPIVFGRSKASERGRAVADLRRHCRKAAAAIARLENVISVTIGEKETGGQPTGQLALIAHVTRKGGQIPAGAVIPPLVDLTATPVAAHVATDVLELAGMPQALGARSGDIVWSRDGDFGTACLTFIKNGRGFVTTNAHVVANIARGQFLLPNVMRPAGSPAPLTLNALPYMSSFGPGQMAREDMAIMETSAAGVTHLGMVGESSAIARIDSFQPNPGARYWYNVNGARVWLGSPQPSPPGISTPMLIDGIWYPYVNFWVLRVTAGQVQHGHSGAVICRGEGNAIAACGILFGGVLPGTAYAFQLQPTFKRAYDRL